MTTGSSQFIEKVTGKTGLSGPGKEHDPREVSEFHVSLPEFSGLDICLVETPGFDPLELLDKDISNLISEWLQQLYVFSKSF